MAGREVYNGRVVDLKPGSQISVSSSQMARQAGQAC